MKVTLGGIYMFDEYGLSGQLSAFVLKYADQKGIISKVSSILAAHDVNIANMRVERTGDFAVMVCELDCPLSKEITDEISGLSEINWYWFYKPENE
jgi:L-serine dehydratase